MRVNAVGDYDSLVDDALYYFDGKYNLLSLTYGPLLPNFNIEKYHNAYLPGNTFNPDPEYYLDYFESEDDLKS